jgi:hypothetical protein
MKKRLVTLLLIGLVAFVLVVGPGCYGGFNLTRQVYTWNTNLGSKWVNEVIFLGFVIIPVYGVTIIGDGLIVNSVEFWGGGSIVNEPEQKIRPANEE